MKALVVEKNHNDEIISSVKMCLNQFVVKMKLLLRLHIHLLNYKDALSSVKILGY